ncbi:transposase [Leisingera sp. M527]|uniref:transposase n=1 Tax=Leisingera sp. M527 TaxID=2867014 RepID=UPI0038FC30DE
MDLLQARVHPPHVLPDGFHRIRHYGLLACADRKANIARSRGMLFPRFGIAGRRPQAPSRHAAAGIGKPSGRTKRLL